MRCVSNRIPRENEGEHGKFRAAKREEIASSTGLGGPMDVVGHFQQRPYSTVPRNHCPGQFSMPSMPAATIKAGDQRSDDGGSSSPTGFSAKQCRISNEGDTRMQITAEGWVLTTNAGQNSKYVRRRLWFYDTRPSRVPVIDMSGYSASEINQTIRSQL